jgi:hypothetical protein
MTCFPLFNHIFLFLGWWDVDTLPSACLMLEVSYMRVHIHRHHERAGLTRGRRAQSHTSLCPPRMHIVKVFVSLTSAHADPIDDRPETYSL